MSKNFLLNISSYVCHFFKIIIKISLIVVTVLFIHFQFSPSSYEDWHFKFPEDRPFLNFHTDTVRGKETIDIKDLMVDDWKRGSLYFNYLKFSLTFILIYSSIEEFGKVLKSVREFRTFHQTNVVAFRKIGKNCFLIFFLSIFNYWRIGDFSRRSISIYLGPLLFALFAFILAEIFKEANNLKEENELTV